MLETVVGIVGIVVTIISIIVTIISIVQTARKHKVAATLKKGGSRRWV